MTGPARSLALIAAIAIGAAAAGFAARAPIERSLLLWSARAATGLVIEADAVAPAAGGYELDGVSVHTVGGAGGFDAPRALVALHGHAIDVDLQSPNFVFDPDRVRGDETHRVGDSLARIGMADATLSLHVRDGSMTVISGVVPEPVLAFGAVAGTLDWRGDPPDFAVTFDLIDGGTHYPVAGHSAASIEGARQTSWTAAALPLHALGAFVPPAALTPTGGFVRDLEVDDGPTLHATAVLDDASATLGSHVLAHLHGPLGFDFGGVGSRGIAGLLDRARFETAGEVHDLPPHFGWLWGGSNDLRSLGALTQAIAGEPNLQSVRIEATAPGLQYGQYALGTDHGPLAVTVLSADPREPTLRFDTALAEDHVISGGERTSAMGLRTGAVAGVNGDYFDIGRTYQPQGLLMRAGELIRGPVDRAALAIDRTNRVTIGEFRLRGTLRVGDRSLPVTQLNDWPCGDVTVITPAFGKMLPPATNTTFASLDPYGNDGKHFRVIDVARTDAPLPVSFGVAFGPRVTVPLRPNDVVELTYRTEPPLEHAVAAIGGGPILLKNGQWYEDPHAPAPDERNYRWPVIALARQADDHLLLVAVDGRHPERSVGMMRPEFAELLRRLGSVDAMALDSGGSVTLVSRATGDASVTVRNVPSDNSAERWVSDALFLYSSARAPSIVPPAAAPTPVPEPRPTP